MRTARRLLPAGPSATLCCRAGGSSFVVGRSRAYPCPALLQPRPCFAAFRSVQMPSVLSSAATTGGLRLCLPVRGFASGPPKTRPAVKKPAAAAGASASEVPSAARVSLPTKENEMMVKKLANLLRNKNPVTAREFASFLRKTSDRKEPTILSDKIVSLLPQLTFEDERSRAKERHEQQRKDRQKGGKTDKADVKRKESAEEREHKAKELAIKEDEDERRKFTIVLASLGKMRKIEGMLYVYGMLKAREEKEEEQIRQSIDEATASGGKAPVVEARWKVDIYMYNLMLDALAKAGYMDKIQEILQEMERSHVDKDRITYSVLYNAYSRQGDDAKAERLWQEMKDRGIEMDLAGFNGLMHSFARKNAIDRVLDTYKQMQVAGIQPDQGTFSILLECCARDALEFRTETAVPTHKPKDSETTAVEEESAASPESEGREDLDKDELYVVDEKERQRILQGKRRRMEAVMRTMKKANIKLDSILINSIVRCYASLGEIEEMFNVVRFLVEEESIKLVEDNYSLMIYCAGRENAIDLRRVKQVFEEMKRNNVQPTARTINAAIHSFAYASPEQLEAFILPHTPPTSQAAGDPEKASDRKNKEKRKEKDEQVSLWHLIKQYGVLVTDDILFDLLKVYATKEDVPVNKADGVVDAEGSTSGHKSERRQLDRSRLVTLLQKMKEEGFGSSLTVLNSLMRFHAAYGENRVREVTTLYNQMKKRQVKPNLQTYLVMVDAVLNTERQVTLEQQAAGDRPAATQEEKEREKERAELSYLLFSEMQSEGVQPNLKLFNSLIELSGFEERRRKVKDAAADQAALGEEEFKQKLLSILNEMQRLGIRPNTKTLKCISSACAVAGADQAGPAIFDELPRLFAEA